MKVINVVMSGSGTIPELGTLSVPGVLSIVDQESETLLGFIEFI